MLLCVAATNAAAVTIEVGPGGNLQGAIDGAQPGDVILLTPGATYVGNFRLTNKTGDAFITIRTSGGFPSMPAEGVRITPVHAAGLAKLQSPNMMPLLTTAEGAHHWRIELVEFVGNGGGDMITLGNGGASQTLVTQMPHDLVFDRVYIHGDPVRGQKRGIALNSGTTHILNSHISDIKVVGQDSQAIAGWNGTGPYVIENNYLEAAGENLMFGGADPSVWNLVPSDVTVRRNHMTKPLLWRTERWSVKNAFELKNARRVLVEGNIFENVWQGAQTGFAVLLTPRNQDGRAPWSVVEDVTLRYNVIRHAGGALNISGFDDVHPSAQASRILVSNNLVYDIDAARWGGTGRFLQIGNQPREITVERNTVFQSGSIVHAYGKPIEQFAFRDNLARHNSYGIIGDGAGSGNGALNTYFPGVVFDRNVLAGGRASSYPAGNYFPSVAEYEASFMSILEENFDLLPTSAFRTAASDGGPLGVNIPMLQLLLHGLPTLPAVPSAPPEAYPFGGL